MNPLHQQINELEQLAAELHDYPGYSWAIDRIRRVVEEMERFEEPDRNVRQIARLRKRYVRTVKIGDQWNTYLQIDHQGFCVVEQTTQSRAKRYGKMLAVALDRMIAANVQGEPRSQQNNP